QPSDQFGEAPKKPSQTTEKEKIEVGAAAGATALGCLGTATLPFSILAVIAIFFAIVAYIHHVIYLHHHMMP
ncbi:MAG TPA: hypothetical protein VME17_05035, partial [Bryobacteraceae bacterium]|nr:hypothetical protein [Bryobacteraceae bacterium]